MTSLLGGFDSPLFCHPQCRAGECIGLAVAVARYPHQGGLVERVEQGAGFIKQGGQSGNRLGLGTADLFDNDAVVAVNEERVGAQSFEFLKGASSALSSASLLQPTAWGACDSVWRVPSGAVITAPQPMRPGLGRALPSQ